MFSSPNRRTRATAPRKHVDRREERVLKVKSASICIDGGENHIPCTVRDIHSSGARMSIAHPQQVGDSFLLIVRSENLVARCKVAWRKTNELGVRFLRVAGLNEEERLKKEQQAAFQKDQQQHFEMQEQARLQSEQEAQQRMQIQAQRAAQMQAARLQIMGMDPTKPYTEEDLKSAYRRQAMAKHPDQGGDPVEFQQLTEIYNLMLQALHTQASAMSPSPAEPSPAFSAD